MLELDEDILNEHPGYDKVPRGRGRMKDVESIVPGRQRILIQYKNGDKEQVEILEDQERGQYIEMEDGDKKYYIAATKEDVARKWRESNTSNTIFCTRVAFRHLTLKDVIDFQESVFLDTVDFVGDIVFEKFVDFSSAIFYRRFRVADWAKFQEGVDFRKAEFREEVSFSEVSSRNVKFDSAEFLKGVDFVSVNVANLASFSNARFRDNASFKSVKCKRMLFESARAENLILRDVEVSESLNLRNSIIDYLDCSGIKVSDAQNRETFRILKNAAIQQNDRISALDFHKKEYKKYAEEIANEEGLWRDKFILWFGYYASEHGTNWALPLFWIVAIILLFESHFLWTSLHNFIAEKAVTGADILHLLSEAVSNLNITDTFEGDPEDGTIFFKVIRTTLISALIYEAIKSFRKFSRRL